MEIVENFVKIIKIVKKSSNKIYLLNFEQIKKVRQSSCSCRKLNFRSKGSLRISSIFDISRITREKQKIHQFSQLEGNDMKFDKFK